MWQWNFWLDKLEDLDSAEFIASASTCVCAAESVLTASTSRSQFKTDSRSLLHGAHLVRGCGCAEIQSFGWATPWTRPDISLKCVWHGKLPWDEKTAIEHRASSCSAVPRPVATPSEGSTIGPSRVRDEKVKEWQTLSKIIPRKSRNRVYFAAPRSTYR